MLDATSDDRPHTHYRLCKVQSEEQLKSVVCVCVLCVCVCVCAVTDRGRSLRGRHFSTPDLLHNVLCPVVDGLVDPLGSPTLRLHYKPTYSRRRFTDHRRERDREMM